MSLRHGLTQHEFEKLQKMVEKGVDWDDIVEHQSDGNKVPHFVDVNMKFVHENIYKPMVRTRELKKKLGGSIHKAVDLAKKWVDIQKELAPEKLTPEDLELVRKFIYAPARQAWVDAEKKKKEAEAE